MNSNSAPTRLLKDPELDRRGLPSRTTRWRLQKQGKFPKPIRLSKQSVGYLEDEIEAWIEARRRERDGEAA